MTVRIVRLGSPRHAEAGPRIGTVRRHRRRSQHGRQDLDAQGEVTDLRGLIGWLAAFLAGSAGWWLGAKVGLASAVLLGAVASGVGLYSGFRWFDNNLK